jgi:hypothetical protein
MEKLKLVYSNPDWFFEYGGKRSVVFISEDAALDELINGDGIELLDDFTD